MKKRTPLYELIDRLNPKEKLFIRKYIRENLNASSKKSYLDFYDVLLKSNQLTDDEVLNKLAKNKLKNYLSEAKFYLNKLIIKALRIHHTVNPRQKNEPDIFLSNLEKQKEIYIYYSKGLYKDAVQLCKKYVKEWEANKDFAMLSFAYKKLHQIELITGTNQTNNNHYLDLYTKLHQSNTEKSKYYYLALKVEADLQKVGQLRTEEDIKIIKTHVYTGIMRHAIRPNIYYWYIKIICNDALLDFEALLYCFEQIELLISPTEINNMEIVNRLQLFSRLTFISISLSNESYYYLYKNEYLTLVSRSTFLTDAHKNMHQLNSKIMESLFLFKQNKYIEMLETTIPNLDIDHYIFEGTIMLNYVDLLFARGKAHFKLLNSDKAYDYFNFIIEHKARLKVKHFTICNAFFHIWLLRYISKEYKVLASIANRYKIFLSTQKINFPLEKALLKFMLSGSNNYSDKNILRNINILLNTLEERSVEAIEKYLIKKLDVIAYLKEIMVELE